MNDDFLRRARRPPSAAFERQLRERLRQQERNETPRRRPSFRLLAIALLVGGTALATATYLTLSRTPLSSSVSPPTPTDSSPQVAPGARQGVALETNRWITDRNAATSTYARSPASAQQGSPVVAARDNRQSSQDSSSSGAAQTSRYTSSNGLETSGAATRPIRIVASPDIAPLAKDKSPGARYTQSAAFEVDSADTALPTLCAEDAAAQPDIVVTSRRMRKQELRLCKDRRSLGILEATLGHIAIVVTRARSGMPMQLSIRTLRLALLKQVPAPDNSSRLIDNPYTHWNQIDPELEDRRIEVLGPARDSQEFLVLAVTLLASACEDNASLDQQLCQTVREDGVYTEARFDANFVPQRLWSDPNAVAIMDYRFYAGNSGDLLGSLLPGAAPTRESIIDGTYVGARTLHAYVNRQRYRNIPRVYSFVNEYLRVPMYLNQGVMLPPDGNLGWRRLYDHSVKLTEVKLD